MPRSFEYRHVVSLEETNLVGNVYFANHVRWQGRCREMFLREHCPEVLDALRGELRLVTLECGCRYLDQLTLGDELAIEMKLVEVQQNRVSVSFSYRRMESDGSMRLVARGHQTIAAMAAGDDGLVQCPVPAALLRALDAHPPT